MDRVKIGYEQTDKKIEIDIYGLVFEIKNVDNEERIETDNLKSVEEEINKVLGIEAVEKINKKRKEDGKEKMDLNIAITVLTFIYNTYAQQIAKNAIETSKETVKNMSNKIDRYNNDVIDFKDRYNNKYNNRKYRRNNRRRY